MTIPGQQGAQPQAQQSAYTYEADKEIVLMFKQEEDGGNMFESDNKIVVTQKRVGSKYGVCVPQRGEPTIMKAKHQS